jgi:hypothetical protein
LWRQTVWADGGILLQGKTKIDRVKLAEKSRLAPKKATVQQNYSQGDIL